MDIDSVLKGHGIGVGGSNIKSIQPIEFSLDTAQLNKTLTIASIDPSKTVVYINELPYSTGGFTFNYLVNCELTNATTVTVARVGADTVATTYLLTVVEYNNVKSKQTGSLATLPVNGINNISISTVNPAKCLAFVSYNTNQNSVVCQSMYALVTTTTNLKIMGALFSTAWTNIKWQVIEFN